MINFKASVLAFAATSALASGLSLWPAPSFAQTELNGVDAYSAGIDLGVTLPDARACTGRGDYREGCVDGVTEKQFEREAEQMLDSEPNDAKPAAKAPVLSPPSDLFHSPFSKPDDGAPQN